MRLDAKTAQANLRDLGEDVFHLELGDAQRWPLDARVLPLHDDAFAATASRYQLGISADVHLALTSPDGETVLGGVANASVGVCGSAWTVQFARSADMRFYGQGEKVTGMKKTGKRTKFWNADVWADPQYAAVPYLLVRHGDRWAGILVDHPGAVFMDTGSNWFFSGKNDQNAPPAFYVIAGNSAAVVTQRLQRLVGKTPLPPLWSLGHHQCRWGYAGTAQQEPWVFGAEALQIIRHHVRLRYKLLPYMYQPLFHDFPNADGMELDRVDDQFLVGPTIMQAPLVQQGWMHRLVALPGTGWWAHAPRPPMIWPTLSCA